MGLKMATIVMESAKVIEACEKTITAIVSERNRRDNETLIKLMQKTMFSFTRGFYKMNRQEAYDWLWSESCLSSWGFSYYAYEDLEHAKKLLKLAQLGDPVTLNEDDTRVIF